MSCKSKQSPDVVNVACVLNFYFCFQMEQNEIDDAVSGKGNVTLQEDYRSEQTDFLSPDVTFYGAPLCQIFLHDQHERSLE